MRALITRPEEDTAPLADALIARNVEVSVEPLLVIRVLDDVEIDLDGVQALLFTSANGVRAFAARSERRDIGVLTVGDASAAAARAAGFAHVESAAGDVLDLVRLVKARLDPTSGALFHAAGSVVAGDLAGQLAEAGYTLRRVTLYEAKPAESLSPEILAALGARDIDLVLFFSPRTAATFVELLGRADDPQAIAGCGKAVALCLSPAVAEAAGAISWKSVRSADRPDLPSMLHLVDGAVTPGVQGEGGGDSAALLETPALPFTPPPIPAAPTPPDRSGVGAVIAAALVAALVTIAGLVTEPMWRPYLASILPAGPTDTPDPALAQRLDALGAEAATLSQRLAALDGMIQQLDARGAGAGSDMADLGARLDALAQESAALRHDLDAGLALPEGAAPQIPENLARLPDEMIELRRRLDEVASAASAATPEPETTAALDALRQDIDAMKQSAAEAGGAVDARLARVEQDLAGLEPLATRLATLEQATTDAETRATGNATLALAVNQLQAALASQRPFAVELAALRDVTADDPAATAEVRAVTDALADRAESGLPTLIELRARFPQVARDVVAAARAESAAAAVASAAPGTGDESAAAPGWLDSAMTRLSELVSVRPVGENVEGDDAAAHVARAEAVLAKGDLAGAVAELDALAGKAAEAAAPWLADARARLDAETAIASLQSLAVARLAPAGNGG